MTNDNLTAIGGAIRKLASEFGEHARQQSQGAPPPNAMLAAALVREAQVLRALDQSNLADALTVLATDVAEMGNG